MEIEPGLAVETLTPLTSKHRSVDMHRLKVWQGEELHSAHQESMDTCYLSYHEMQPTRVYQVGKNKYTADDSVCCCLVALGLLLKPV